MHTTDPNKDVVTDEHRARPDVAAPDLSAVFTQSSVSPTIEAVSLEKRGRSWLLWSFLLCPCHLPWTLAILGGVLASTSLGVFVRDHAWIAGTIVTVAWIAGTGYGFHLIRLAQHNGGACSVRGGGAARRWMGEPG